MPLIGDLPGAPGCRYLRLDAVAAAGPAELATASRTARILVENVVRSAWRSGGEQAITEVADTVRGCLLAAAGGPSAELEFRPSRVLLQDHSGVPVLADLASLRSLLAERGLDTAQVDLAVPADLVVDHSVEAHFAGPDALDRNLAREFALNEERYRFLRWAVHAFRRLRVVPPGTGIVHQVHLEHLARVVHRDADGLLSPDTVLGTDSHTPMVNALGVLGWGVGGIDALAVLLGEPVSVLAQPVIGVRLVGTRRAGVLATDVALAMTEFLRDIGVVGAMVEFFGPGVAGFAVPDRATVANMAPEYGCTTALFPVDAAVLDYLRLTGRDPQAVTRVEAYARAQGLFAEAAPAGGAEPDFARVLTFDLSEVGVGAAGPGRPQDRLSLSEVAGSFRALPGPAGPARGPHPRDGDLAVAAITSCTNTANPEAMVTAGLVARAAADRGLQVPPWVKATLAPGSRAVTRYLEAAGLLAGLAAIGFHPVAYGCTTCIGNSGPLTEQMAAAVRRATRPAAVLSGNRNFGGRIHADVAAAYLVSPPLVVAFALAGTVLVDPATEPLGTDRNGAPVRLDELWPAPAEVREALTHVEAGYRSGPPDPFAGDERWRSLSAGDDVFSWADGSTYLRRSPLVRASAGAGLRDIDGARVLVVAGDLTTTDQISPAGTIPPDSPAGAYLRAQGVPAAEFNSYGCRRGNHDVMVRGVFANPRFVNALCGQPGNWTRHLPDGAELTVPEAAGRYAAEQVPLVVLAGRNYGMGSSRDWAAKGPRLLGVRAILAESFERIHRSNLVGMGILPLQFEDGRGAAVLGLRGDELYDISGLGTLRPRGTVRVRARRDDGTVVAEWGMQARVDTARDLEYLRSGGILSGVATRYLG
jgi:aconitate hydratase